MSFMELLEATINEGEYNQKATENGAIGYRTTGKKLLDFNFSVPSMRNAGEIYIVSNWESVYLENKLYALLWLFYASDVRGGLGERRLFKIIYHYIGCTTPDIAKGLFDYVPEYSRWDNVFCLMGISKDLDNFVITKIKNQLEKDMQNMAGGMPISLLAKWMPSINTSNDDQRYLARRLAKGLGLSEKQYRKMLSKMRKYLDVIEVKTSANKWGEIDYSKVPSNANLKYKDAFIKHDPERRVEYLESVKNGEAKINSSVLFPHGIVHKYTMGGSHIDYTLEELWSNLPDYAHESSSTIVVADGSGSMRCNVGGSASSVTALEVCRALAIYFAERCSGPFKDKFITFSHNPDLVDLSSCNSLIDRLSVMRHHTEVADTAIDKVFKLILDTAIANNLDQKDIPNILIISDMEFNSCATFDGIYCYDDDDKLFNQIQNQYASHGYKLPKLSFWNVNSRTNTIPVKENNLGVTLVSGFSPAIAKMVLSNETDPYKILIDTITSERYSPIAKVCYKLYGLS